MWLLLGVCTDTMCIDLSIMILDSPTDEKEGKLGTARVWALLVSSVSDCAFGFKPFWHKR